MGRWIREGECPPERCQGRCCKVLGLWFDKTADSKDFLKALRARGAHVLEVNGKYLAGVPQTCQHLTEDNLCALHPAMRPVGKVARPKFCDSWPMDPSQLVLHSAGSPFGECGYTFRWEEGDITH